MTPGTVAGRGVDVGVVIIRHCAGVTICTGCGSGFAGRLTPAAVIAACRINMAKCAVALVDVLTLDNIRVANLIVTTCCAAGNSPVKIVNSMATVACGPVGVAVKTSYICGILDDILNAGTSCIYRSCGVMAKSTVSSM
jgi:hypothetical protein